MASHTGFQDCILHKQRQIQQRLSVSFADSVYLQPSVPDFADRTFRQLVPSCTYCARTSSAPASAHGNIREQAMGSHGTSRRSCTGLMWQKYPAARPDRPLSSSCATAESLFQKILCRSAQGDMPAFLRLFFLHWTIHSCTGDGGTRDGLTTRCGAPCAGQGRSRKNGAGQDRTSKDRRQA